MVRASQGVWRGWMRTPSQRIPLRTFWGGALGGAGLEAELGQYFVHAAAGGAGLGGGGGQEEQVVGIAEGGDARSAVAAEFLEGRVEGMEVEVAQQGGQRASLDQAAGAWPKPSDTACAGRQDLFQQPQDKGIGQVGAYGGQEEGMVDGIEAVGHIEVEGPREGEGVGGTGEEADGGIQGRGDGAAGAIPEAAGCEQRLENGLEDLFEGGVDHAVADIEDAKTTGTCGIGGFGDENPTGRRGTKAFVFEVGG